MIFEAVGTSLDGLSLRGENALLPLRLSSGDSLPSGPRSTPAGNSGGASVPAAAGRHPLPKAVSPASKGQPQPKPSAFGQKAAEEVRTWTDKTGDYTFRATLVDCQDGKVALRKEDGITIFVPLEKLCRFDQVYVRQRFKSSRGGGRVGYSTGARRDGRWVPALIRLCGLVYVTGSRLATIRQVPAAAPASRRSPVPRSRAEVAAVLAAAPAPSVPQASGEMPLAAVRQIPARRTRCPAPGPAHAPPPAPNDRDHVRRSASGRRRRRHTGTASPDTVSGPRCRPRPTARARRSPSPTGLAFGRTERRMAAGTPPPRPAVCPCRVYSRHLAAVPPSGDSSVHYLDGDSDSQRRRS